MCVPASLFFQSGCLPCTTAPVTNDALIFVQIPNTPNILGREYNLETKSRTIFVQATWLAGSYQKADSKLNIPLKSGNSLTLFLTKEADVEFASSLISLLKTIKRGIQVHKDFSGGIVSHAELLVCHFTGIKALEDEYGSAEIVKQGAEVVQTALTKAFDQLQGAYNGKIVGLVISAKEASTSLASIIDAPSSLHISRRLAEASKTNATASIAAIYLVRLSLAWITGIILLVSTLIGICLLMNMPLTRDTLLYSNVKID
ncbi:unnamed protein product [Triticum turgidum subsp. durum]|uniref:DUF7794 domain-containing protein n=1 Tax=Triticum turgidum subsp. durum TaxID=4567 RepID=A0A9R0ZZS9_TRITD|nr:unnamed protein product [Triticum turgidum subsp. durum]